MTSLRDPSSYGQVIKHSKHGGSVCFNAFSPGDLHGRAVPEMQMYGLCVLQHLLLRLNRGMESLEDWL